MKNTMKSKMIALTMSAVTAIAAVLGSRVETTAVSHSAEKQREDYIVMVEAPNLMSKYSKKDYQTQSIGDNAGEHLKDNNIIALKMTEEEKKKLENDEMVKNIEEDMMVSACAMTEGIKLKKTRSYKKNNKKSQWNMQMIHADREKKKTKNGVKIAILDSGVDAGNDIDLAYSISLVPGEEEMNPLFMDGTGHGDSVAGLIAAKDNDEGITGVNPDAEVYSIRVLDDYNRAPISRVIEGIYIAIEQKVDIINMSFGISKYSEALHQAVVDAQNAGILIVAAAGNTGKEGVQYPAAYDEVMAVGSVDKNGDMVDSSAKGDEVEVLAPGELVRSTGMFGSEFVGSGTSLAAPQVAGVASLIMSRNPKLKAEEVREIIQRTANEYTDANNNVVQLVDAEESLTHRVKQRKNNKEIVVYDDTGCVEGCWSVTDHQNVIGNYGNVKKGARFNDMAKNYSGYYIGKRTEGAVYKVTGMDNNPWWHGYFRKNYSGQEFCNYVASYIYETRVANAISAGGNIYSPGDISTTVQNTIKKDVKEIPWTKQDRNGNKMYTSTPSPGVKRAFVWGMAIHILADSFAHSVTTWSGSRVKHSSSNKSVDADNTAYLSMRWTSAQKAVKLALQRYEKGAKISGTSNEFSPVKSQGQFKMINIEKYITSVDGAKNGATYASRSVYKNYKNND